MSSEFSEEACNELGNYVYRLVDPRNCKYETFYVGKGSGNRVFSHARGVEQELKKIKEEIEKEESELNDKDSEGFEPPDLKSERINEILKAGFDVKLIIHRHGIKDAKLAFAIESALIDAYPNLMNKQSGHGNSAMTVEEIIKKYDLLKFEENPSEKLLLININALEADTTDRNAIYEQVRASWRVDKKRAEEVDYVLAVRRGVVIGAFVAKEWYRDENNEKRWCFNGHEAEEAIWQRFVGENGKRIVNDNMKHTRYPLRYWKA